MLALRYLITRWPTKTKCMRKYTLQQEPKRKSFFERHLLFTNITTSGICMLVGDAVEQEFEFRSQILDTRYDWGRLGRMFIVGMMIGPIHHNFYNLLDKMIPKVNFKAVLFKILIDQSIASPLVLFVFYYGMGLLEGKPFGVCTDEFKQKFLKTYEVDWMYWPPVQFINFYLLPTQYRVIYVNIATMIYNTFLSYMKHCDQFK